MSNIDNSENGVGPCICGQIPLFEGLMVPHNMSNHTPVLGHHESSQFEKIASRYTDVHGVLSLMVCALGIPMNMLNVFVLTRPHMRTPVNTILTWLAVFDLLTMGCYVPFSLHFYCFYPSWTLSPERNSLGWMTFMIVHMDFTSTTHTISNWLGVTLAAFRYKHIFLPAKGHLTRIRRLVRARIAVFIVVVLSIVVMIPNYIMNRIMPLGIFIGATNETAIVYASVPLNLGTPDVGTLPLFNLWLHGLVAKLLPCILMVFYSGLLLKTLRTNVKLISKHSATLEFPVVAVRDDSDGSSVKFRAENETDNRGQIHVDTLVSHLPEPSFESRSGSPSASVTTVCISDTDRQRESISTGMQQIKLVKSRRPQDNVRTTRMLLAVIILFVISELPQAFLIILSAVLPNFFNDIYLPLGDMMDMLALLNNGINFLLYCVMSRDFRKTLVNVFNSKLCQLKRKSFKRIGQESPFPKNGKVNSKTSNKSFW